MRPFFVVFYYYFFLIGMNSFIKVDSNIKIAPIICRLFRDSFNIKWESKSATSGSIYVRMAIVVASTFVIVSK